MTRQKGDMIPDRRGELKIDFSIWSAVSFSDVVTGPVPGADEPAAPGCDGGVREAAAEGRSEAEGQGAAGKGLRRRQGQRRQSARLVCENGEKASRFQCFECVEGINMLR